MLENRTNDMSLLCDLAFQIATAPKISKRDFALAGEALKQAEKLVTTNKSQVMITQAVLLFESGKLDEGLTLATQALASAKSPKDTNNIQSCISTMKTRQAAMKSGQSNTNQSSAAAAAVPVSGATTNQTNSAPGKDAAGKP